MGVGSVCRCVCLWVVAVCCGRAALVLADVMGGGSVCQWVSVDVLVGICMCGGSVFQWFFVECASVDVCLGDGVVVMRPSRWPT
jgi:hypothetical protein